MPTTAGPWSALRGDPTLPRWIRLYVRWVDHINEMVGRVVLYMIFVMIALLLYAALSRTLFNAPLTWGIEMAQFLLAAYFLLGGGYSLRQDAHVRMDVFYSRWPERGRAFADTLTAVCLVFYLIVLLLGGIASSEYAIAYSQKNYSAWAPPLAPIKIVMTIGIGLMLLQTIAIFFRDLARVRGETLH